MREEVDKLLALDNGKFTSTTDSYGFTWLVRETSPDDLEGLVTDLHAVNTSLVDAGFGNALLCTLVSFTNGSQSLGLVYLYKRGSWYPFVPVGTDRRDNATELQIKSVIGADLNFEPGPRPLVPGLRSPRPVGKGCLACLRHSGLRSGA